ncbi:MAG: DNA polymerase Y family protein, partial [Dokdonella sp.]
MLWASILLPQLAIDAAILEGVDPGSAFALIDGPLQRRHVVAVSTAARAGGVRIGQPLAAAQAVLPSLHSAVLDRAASARLREAVTSIAYTCSECVNAREDDAVTLEIGASLRYFGGWPRLAARLREPLSALGVQHRLGVAPTPLASILAASERDGRILDERGLRELLRRLP